jgi:hypothetical protein
LDVYDYGNGMIDPQLAVLHNLDPLPDKERNLKRLKGIFE